MFTPMLMTAAMILAVGSAGLLAAFLVLHGNQLRRYRRLEALQENTIPTLAAQVAFTPPAHVPSFARRVVVIDNLLPAEVFDKLRSAALRCQRTERNYLPGHKKGGTISYEELHLVAPEIVAFFKSRGLHVFCSAIVGEPLVPTPINDQSSCSLLYYEKPGDHIGWHFDHNFYHGRHFTVLVPLVNMHRETGQPSSAQLMIQLDGKDEVVPTLPNSFILFEGARVLHKVTPLGENEQRITLSMTFCTDPSAPLVKAVARRVKDTAFFGIRALWT